MPRKARIDAAGAIHHIIVRGIERRKIFREDADRVDFLKRLGNILLETNTDCYAWSLMPNHAHFLLKTGMAPIATVMRRLLTGYAVSFNRKYHRHGKLFQNRYKSILCQEDIYLKELVRYIHLNPLRADLITDLKTLEKYPWSGHSVMMGKIKRDWQNTDYVLGYFGKKRNSARNKYHIYILKGAAEGKRPELTGGGLIRSFGGWEQVKGMRKLGIRLKGDERILGDSDFVQQVLAVSNEQLHLKYALKNEGYDFNRIVKRVAEILDIEPKEVLFSGKRPQTVIARSLLCFFANRKLGMSTVEIAQRLNMCQSAVSRSAFRGEMIAAEQKLKL